MRGYNIWFEQVLQQHINPRITDLVIRDVPLGPGRAAVVVDIPAATGDPHQASDKKYYRRHNFNRLAMEHYEIRALFNRTGIPEPYVTIELPSQPTDLVWGPPTDNCVPIPLIMNVGNKSREPALYTHIALSVDQELLVTRTGANLQLPGSFDDGHPARVLIFHIMAPGQFPLFREIEFALGSGTMIAIAKNYRDADSFYRVGYAINTPGYSFERRGKFIKRVDRLWLNWDDPT